uniref:Uncharacterized protein n=1 Tax=Ascaris lumbricoides TaxID=6252 RepID=A0A9J2PGF8_ASCLU
MLTYNAYNYINALPRYENDDLENFDDGNYRYYCKKTGLKRHDYFTVQRASKYPLFTSVFKKRYDTKQPSDYRVIWQLLC